MSMIFYIIGGLTMLGGLIMGNNMLEEAKLVYQGGELFRNIGIVYFVTGFIGGMFFIGFGKIIDLLQQINQKTDNTQK